MYINDTIPNVKSEALQYAVLLGECVCFATVGITEQARVYDSAQPPRKLSRIGDITADIKTLGVYAYMTTHINMMTHRIFAWASLSKYKFVCGACGL